MPTGLVKAIKKQLGL
ncbi:hypothetical protein [Snodgrassella communis]|nr:hypothetical protein [Snodgrassella communis]